jgi:catechol 2,3-dioxygenase-like lactoylglutathione lyase family enzyme
MSARIVVTALDHLVMTVADIPRTIDFYERVLGMHAQAFGDGRTALHFGVQKINLHEVGTVVDPNVRHATPGSADLCLVSATPMAEVIAALGELGVPIVEGPVERTGAQGKLRSVYIYDPDENLIELANLEAGG